MEHTTETKADGATNRRTGSLLLRSKGWYARVRCITDGKVERRGFYLDTFDRGVAEQRLATAVAQINAGEVIAPSKAKASKPVTLAGLLDLFTKERESENIIMAREERALFRDYIAPVCGGLPIARFTPADANAALKRAADAKLSKSTCRRIRSLMSRMFTWAVAKKWLLASPIDESVKVPITAKVDGRERAVLTDEEFARLVTCTQVDFGFRVMCMVSRVLGGMRSAEVVRWDWSCVDTRHFSQATIMRAKTGKFQPINLPPAVAAYLKEWWELNGRPKAGPVFPVLGEMGPSKRSERNANLAEKLRLALHVAGVTRHECTRPADAPAMKRREACCPDMAYDELFSDTLTTRPVDFHSFRRAFATALAAGGVNAQVAMALTSHTDMNVHKKYWAAMKARHVPDVAVPVLPAFSGEASAEGSVRDQVDPNALAPVGVAPREVAQNKVNGVALASVGERSGYLPTKRQFAEPSGNSANRETNSDSLTPFFPRSFGKDWDHRSHLGDTEQAPIDPVEVALAKALELAVHAGNIEAVLAITGELKARRESAAKAADVVPLKRRTK